MEIFPCSKTSCGSSVRQALEFPAITVPQIILNVFLPQGLCTCCLCPYILDLLRTHTHTFLMSLLKCHLLREVLRAVRASSWPLPVYGWRGWGLSMVFSLCPGPSSHSAHPFPKRNAAVPSAALRMSPLPCTLMPGCLLPLPLCSSEPHSPPPPPRPSAQEPKALSTRSLSRKWECPPHRALSAHPRSPKVGVFLPSDTS